MKNFLFGDLTKEGKGVSKNENQENRFILFFQIYLRKFWKLMYLNILYFIFCLPLITIGPATAAFCKILKNYATQRNAFILADFWEAFKKNFKQGLIVGISDILIIYVMYVSTNYYAAMMNQSMLYAVLLGLTLFFVFTLILTHFYIYLMMVTVHLKIKDIIKNSFALSIIEFKTNMITFISVFAVCAFLYLLFPLTVIIIPFFPLSFMGLIVCFNSYPKIRKHIIQPYYDARGEVNPDDEYLAGNNDDLYFKDTIK